MNDDTGYVDGDGRALHHECYAAERALASQESPTQTVPIHLLGRWRTFATRMIKEAIGVLAEGHN